MVGLVFVQGLKDVSGGFSKLPLANWLAGKDLKARYARTALGPFWSVASNALFAGALALTFGTIFNVSLREFLPYMAVSLAIWNTLSALIAESTNVFQRSQGTIQTYALPLSLYVHKMVIDKLMMMFHFLLVYLVIGFVFPPKVSWVMAHFVLAVPIFYLFGFGCGLFFGTLGIRWRDISPAIYSITTLLFLITPVFWQKTESLANFANMNPFYHLLEIGRGPLQGYAPEPLNWIVAAGAAGFMFVMGLLVFCLRRRDIFYWM